MSDMTRWAAATLVAAMALATPAWGDPWKDESGHGKSLWSRHWGGHERELKHRDGDCKVEREWKKDGEYKEKIECEGPPWRRGYRIPPVVIYQDREWVNPDGSLPAPPQGPEYGRIYRSDDGRYCREYQTTGRIDGRRERLYGTACLGPDGQWAFND